MKLEDIKEALTHQPHVKKVWVTVKGYYTSPVVGATLIDLENEQDIKNIPQEVTTVKQSKRKNNGTK
jgi:hypothetical protein